MRAQAQRAQEGSGLRRAQAQRAHEGSGPEDSGGLRPRGLTRAQAQEGLEQVWTVVDAGPRACTGSLCASRIRMSKLWSRA